MTIELEIDEETDGRIIVAMPSRPSVAASGVDAPEAFRRLLAILDEADEAETPVDPVALADEGLADWAAGLPPAPEFDPNADVAMRWDPSTQSFIKR